MFRFETWVTYVSHVSIWNMGHLCFACFEKPVSVLDEKSNKTGMWFMFQIHLKEMRLLIYQLTSIQYFLMMI